VSESKIPRCTVPHRLHLLYGTIDLTNVFSHDVTHLCANRQRMITPLGLWTSCVDTSELDRRKRSPTEGQPDQCQANRARPCSNVCFKQANGATGYPQAPGEGARVRLTWEFREESQRPPWTTSHLSRLHGRIGDACRHADHVSEPFGADDRSSAFPHHPAPRRVEFYREADWIPDRIRAAGPEKGTRRAHVARDAPRVLQKHQQRAVDPLVSPSL
jgi:hypothetical protein